MDRALTAIGEGCTFPMLYNDDVNVPPWRGRSAFPRTRLCTTCRSGAARPRWRIAVASPNGVVNLPKALELALRNGWDPSRAAGSRTPATPASFLSFEDLWQAYAAQLGHAVPALAEHEASSMPSLAARRPSSSSAQRLSDFAFVVDFLTELKIWLLFLFLLRFGHFLLLLLVYNCHLFFDLSLGHLQLIYRLKHI